MIGFETDTTNGPVLAMAGALVARNAFATADQAKDWLAGHAKGTPQAGKVTLKAPEIAENGNAVPLTVSVESEMSEKSYVKAIYVAADGNPNPGVAVFELTPLSGKAEIALRVRLQQTAEDRRGGRDERRLALHGEPRGQGHHRRLRRLRRKRWLTTSSRACAFPPPPRRARWSRSRR